MDLFYYGSQDVPLPLMGGPGIPARLKRSGAQVYCENCSAAVDAADLKGGRASEIFGLVLCETCRMKARAEERIELYFCDRCQVSVPVCRVDTGEALAGDGRILCLECRQRRSAGFRMVRLLPVLLVLIAVVAGVLLLTGRGPKPSEAVAPRLEIGSVLDSALLSGFADLGEVPSAAGVSDRLSRLDLALSELVASRDAIIAELAEQQAALRELGTQFDERMSVLEHESASLHQELDRLIAEPAPVR